jgi:hypothetical protein
MTLSYYEKQLFSELRTSSKESLFESSRLRDSRKTTWFMENYMIHGKLRDSRGPCRGHVGIIIFCVKNYVIHKKLHDSWKTTWFTKKLLMTFLLKEIVPTFVYIHTM